MGKLSSLLARHVAKAQEAAKRPGNLGRLLSTGLWQFYPEDNDRPGFVVVRVNDGNNSSFIECYNRGVPIIADLPLQVIRNGQGIDECFPNGLETQQWLGTGADSIGAVAPHSHEIGGGNADMVSGRRIREGLLHITNPPSLSLDIEPFAYKSYEGLNKVYGPDTFDITSYLPVTTDAWAWVIVGFDIATETIEAATGSDYFTLDTLAESQIADIPFADRIVLGALRVNEADTAISDESRFASYPDIRQFLGSPSGSPGLDKAVVDSTGNVVTMNGEIVWQV